MRWEDLIADLEAQGEAQDEATRAAEVADRSRHERAQVDLTQRLLAMRGRATAMVLSDGSSVQGILADVGPDWVLIGADQVLDREVIVPTVRISAIRRAAAWSDVVDLAPTASRLDLRWLLGRVSRDRSPVRLSIVGGLVLSGTIDRVGADHLDLALHDVDAFRRTREVADVVVVPFRAVITVTRG